MTEKAGFNLISRLKASGIHLVFSFIIFLIAMYMIRYVWFPGVHFWINGGIEGTKILVLVDLILGPLITFIIWNKRKPAREQKQDIGIILAIQMIMLGYGLYNIHSQRPVVATLAFDGTYRTALSSDLEWGEFIKKETVHKMSSETPPFVYLRVPKTEDEKGGFATYLMMSKAGVSGATYLYEDIHSSESLEEIESMTQYSRKDLEKDKKRAEAIKIFRDTHPEAKHFFPFYARSGKAIVALDKDANIVGFLAVERLTMENYENEKD